MARPVWPEFIVLEHHQQVDARQATLNEMRVDRAITAQRLDLLDAIIRRAQSDDRIIEDEPLYQQLFPLADKLKAVERRAQRRLSNRGF